MENIEITKDTYPIKDGRKRIWAIWPVQVTQEDLHQTANTLTVGKWVGVNIHLTGGYTHLVAPCEFDTYEECHSACRIHNSIHGWSDENVEHILENSMIANATHDGLIGEL